MGFHINYACGESGEHGKCTDVNPRVLSHVGRAQWEGGGEGACERFFALSSMMSYISL